MPLDPETERRLSDLQRQVEELQRELRTPFSNHQFLGGAGILQDKISAALSGSSILISGNNTLNDDITDLRDGTGLADSAITTAKIAASAITAPKVAVWPRCRVRRSVSDQSITDSVETEILFQAEDVDTDTMWSADSDITIKTAGLYWIHANVQWGANATQSRYQIAITKNDVRFSRTNHNDTGLSTVTTWFQNCAGMSSCAVNDIINLKVFQKNGNAAAVGVVTDTDSTFCEVIWLGPAS